MRGVDHPAVTEVDTDVLDRARAGTEEHQVPGGQRAAGRQDRAGVVLVLRDPGRLTPTRA